MSSMEKEKVLEKKREGPCSPGRPKVFESNKEKKKRRLILSDSESDEDKYLISPRKKALTVPAADQNGNSSPIKEKVIIDETKVDSNRALKSDAVKQREKADSDKKVPVFCGVDKNGNVSPIKNMNGIGRLSIEEEIKVESKRALRSEVVKQREEADSNKKTSAVSGADQNRNDSPIKKKNSIDRLTGMEEIKVKSNRVLRSEVFKKREEADSNTEKVTESRSDRKRSRETVDAETSVKIFKSESLKYGREQTKQSGEKTMKNDILKEEDKRSDIRADRVPGSKPVVSTRRQRDDSNEKRLQGNLKEIDKPEDEQVRWIERSGQRPLRKLKDNRVPSVGVKREEVGFSNRKGIRVQGKGGVLRVLSSNKKVPRLEEVHIQKVDEENIKSTTKHPSLSREIKGIEKSSSIKSDKNQLNPGKVSSAERGRPCKEKTEPEISSPKIKSKCVDVSNGKTDCNAKKESKSKSKASLLTKQNTKEEASEGRGTMKQKIREQIKKILLDAGWKIELRPRKGRDYEDAVYVSPLGGSGYWSITKAYAVYLDQCNSEHGDKSKDLSGKSSKKSNGSDKSHEGTRSTVAAIPMDLLSMLKRNVVNKRRRMKELDETQKKLGVSRNGKGTIKIKDSKNKHSKGDRGVKERKKPNNALGIVGSTAQKLHLRARNKKQRGCALLVRGANQEAETDIDDYVPYVWKRTVLSWMIDLGVVRANGKVKYMNKRQTRTMLEGWITRDGICCGCCSKIITISKFEIHAGSKLCQPYKNIFVEEAGISLLQCQLNAWEKQEESERQGFYNINIDGDDPNDDTCGICGDGGDLICCDGCPSTFHLNCLGIQMLPPGDWHCTNCSCRFCGLVSDAASEGSGLTISPLLTCSQCEKKYHQECIPEADAISVGSNNSGTSFCGQSCKKVFKRLQKLLGIKNDLEAGFSWSLIRRFDEDSSGLPCSLPRRAECNSKLAVALAVMDECFLPIIDQRSDINLIHNVVYNCGSNINRLSYSGFYTFILERGDELISAASVRIHGTRLAEMPFIGTRNMYRRQGMCRRLLNGIELALYSLNIEKLIIPAISELTETWTSIFGFKPLELSEKQEIRSINMLVFPGTGLLQKPILKKDSAEQHTIANGAEQGEPVIKHHRTIEAASESSVLSYVQPNPCGSGDVVVHPKHEVKDVELILPTNESYAPHESECQAPNCKSSVIAADVDLLVQPEVVCHNEPVGEEAFQINSSSKPKIEVHHEGTVHENHEAKNEDAAVASSLYAVDDTSVRHATVIKHHDTLEAANVSSVLSPVWPNSCGSDEVVLPSIHEVKDVELILPTNESSDACGSECQAPDYKSSETAVDGDLLEVVYHNEPVGGDTFQINSSNEAKIEVSCVGTVHGNHEAKNEDAAVASILYTVDDTSVKHATEDRCTSPEATASTLRDSGAKTAPNLLATDDTLLQHSSDAHSTSPGVNSSNLQDSGGNSLHNPVFSLEWSSDATLHNKSEATSKSSSPSLVEHGFLAASERIADDKHDREDKFIILQPKSKPFGNNSGQNGSDSIIGPMDPVDKKFFATSVESNVDVVGEGAATDFHEVKAEVDGVKHKANANDEDGEPYTSRVIDRPLDIAPGKESQACESSVTSDSGTVTEPFSGFQVSYRRSVQQNYELLQEPPECSSSDLPLAIDKLIHSNHDSTNTLHLSSLPKCMVSSRSGGMLKNSHETNTDPGPFEQNPYSSGENSTQHHIANMFNESLGVDCEFKILSSCGVKSYEMPGETPNSNVAYSLAPDADNHSERMVTKDSAPLVLGDSNSCAFIEGILPDTHNAKSENASVSHGYCAIAKSPKHYSAEGVNGPDGVSNCNGATSGWSLNKVEVQHALKNSNEVAVDACVEPGHSCAEGVPDTILSEDDLAAVVPAHSFGLTSVHCASKVVTKSLDNGSELSNELAEVSML